MAPAFDRESISERRIAAIAVSRGVGIGHVVEFRDDEKQLVHHTIGPEEVDAELARFRRAVEQCRHQIEGLVESNGSPRSDELTAIFHIQLAILLDPTLTDAVESSIREHYCNAAWAVSQAAADLVRRQSKAEDTTFREKRLDVEDVCERLVATLDGTQLSDRRVFAGAVILARELRPSTILELHRNEPAAIVTERGGWTSHSSIVAREFRIPMVSGVRAAEHGLRAGLHAIVDGDNGLAIVQPSAETVERFSTSVPRRSRRENNTAASAAAGAVMLDGTRITIRANADIPESYLSAQLLGAEGIGLFRSESLIRRPGRIPSEDEQTAAYIEIARAAGAHGVKIRTFDIGVDRYLPNAGTAEQNPALGLRAVRLSLREQEYLRCQIRAMLRAATAGRIDIVLPMVAGPGELTQAAAIIDEERRSLQNAGVAVGDTKLGAMIEVPSGVLTAPEIAARADFLSLGTNDLVQYLLAVDRDNYAVADWYQSLHPAVIRAIKSVVEGAAQAAIPLVVCGEMAASPFYLPVLIGLGVRELSLNVNSINQIRTVVEGITADECTELVRQIAALETAPEIEAFLRDHYRAKWSNLIPENLLLK